MLWCRAVGAPSAFSVEVNGVVKWCGAGQWYDNQSNPLSNSTVLLCRRNVATVSMPYPSVTFVGAKKSNSVISVNVLHQSHRRSGNWHSAFDFFIPLPILTFIL
ncbi:hypothetical protein DEO72_LG5g2190 [Vigna unguiculata]|uniref:Uncharacterized protein n=1 Tax=Vigna unguiculata TaxID=3917 RepID=A0A4D6M0P2_VIGUN|nr:hypothetical protein DEO72_LG5g2190 [Vigna unguiculata]